MTLKGYLSNVYTDELVYKDSVLYVKDGRVCEISPSISSNVDLVTIYKDKLIVPGFIDVQVNGAGGILFNDAPTLQSLFHISEVLKRTGVTAFVPTLISDQPEKTPAAAKAVNDAVHAGLDAVCGFHLEGPFLSQTKAGIHKAEFIRRATPKDIKQILWVRDLIYPLPLIVTIAPETFPTEYIRELASKQIIVSIGHTIATCTQAFQAIGAGASNFTHLMNAMAGLTSRDPGAALAPLIREDVGFGFIGDALHLDPLMLKLILACGRHKRACLVTDAMPPLGTDLTEFQLYGSLIFVVNGACQNQHGQFAGSSVPMHIALSNVNRALDENLPAALRTCTQNPAQMLGIKDRGTLSSWRQGRLCGSIKKP